MMHKVIVKSTFLEVQGTCSGPDEEQRPVLRSKTTSDLARHPEDVEQSAEYAECVIGSMDRKQHGNSTQKQKEPRLPYMIAEEQDSVMYLCRARTNNSLAPDAGRMEFGEPEKPKRPGAASIGSTAEDMDSQNVSEASPCSSDDLPELVTRVAIQQGKHLVLESGLKTQRSRCADGQHIGFQDECMAVAEAEHNMNVSLPPTSIMPGLAMQPVPPTSLMPGLAMQPVPPTSLMPGFAMQPSSMIPAYAYAAAAMYSGMMAPWQAANVHPLTSMPPPRPLEQLGVPSKPSEPGRQHRSAVVAGEDSNPGMQPPARARTTVMLRNIPNNYTRAMLRELLDSEGFAGCYDFLYLPHDFKTQAGLGFAFLNLLTNEDAERIRVRFTGFRRWTIPSAKTCVVALSGLDQQGLHANIERYRNSSVMHASVPEECKPLMLKDGVPVQFPAATRKLWPPHDNYGVRARRGERSRGEGQCSV